jgi:UPF0755 protein
LVKLVRKKLLVTFLAVGLFTLAVGVLFFILTRQFLFEGPEKKGREVVYEVKLGQSFPSLAQDLKKLGVIKNAQAFALYARVSRQIPKIKVGEYGLNTSMTPTQVMRVITSGQSILRSLTIPEGYSIFEIAELLEMKGYASRSEILKLSFDKNFVRKVLGVERSSLEGYLFPETYLLTKYMGAEKILSEMIQTFKTHFEKVPKPYPMGWNDLQVVTMASIIEKETGAPHERQLISSVFHNRLKKNMRLQTDPTVIYAKALRDGKIQIDIKKSDLSWDHPYNTYMRAGLPPGPISNPGFEALKAAVNPAITDFLFFVSQNDGTHVFSESYEKHNQAVRKFQQNRKAREGKSWRDLSK